MTTIKILGQQELPNIPWEDRPAGANGPLWRYSRNPVIPRDLIPTSNSIFNSAVVPFGAGSPACSAVTTGPGAWSCTPAFSDDGLQLGHHP